MRTSKLYALACLLTVVCLAGCWSSKPNTEADSKPKEIPTSVGKPSELSEDDLIFRAKRYYEVGLYSESRENFEAIRSTYPLGPYGEFAEIKSADAVYDEGSFADAAKAYEEIARNRPVSEALPYVLFRAARSYQLSQRGIGRDMSALDKAQEKYEELLRRFPESRHAWAAKELVAAVLKDKATYAASIRDFYTARGKKAAAEKRDSRIVQVENPAVEAAVSRAAAAPAIEITKLALLREQVEAAQSDRPDRHTLGHKMASLDASMNSSNAMASPPISARRITRVECKAFGNRIQASVIFNKELDDKTWVDSLANHSSFKIPNVVVEQATASLCGASTASISVATNGTVDIKGIKPTSTVTTMINPPRLIILATIQ